MEEVEDEDARWVQDFPDKVQAGAAFGPCETQFEECRRQQKGEGHEPWYPFQSEEEWELARWLMTSGLSQSKTDDFLKLKSVRAFKKILKAQLIDPQVREGIKPAFHNNRAFLKHVDALPEGPGWRCHPLDLEGDEFDADGLPRVQTVDVVQRPN